MRRTAADTLGPPFLPPLAPPAAAAPAEEAGAAAAEPGPKAHRCQLARSACVSSSVLHPVELRSCQDSSVQAASSSSIQERPQANPAAQPAFFAFSAASFAFFFALRLAAADILPPSSPSPSPSPSSSPASASAEPPAAAAGAAAAACCSAGLAPSSARMLSKSCRAAKQQHDTQAGRASKLVSCQG